MAEILEINSKKCCKRARVRKLRMLRDNLLQAIERSQVLPPQSLSQASGNRSRLLTPKQASAQIGLSVKTLANLRSTGMADLPYRKIGSRIFYRRSDVLKYRKARKFYSTSEYPQAQEGGAK